MNIKSLKINPIHLALLVVLFFSWLQISDNPFIKSTRDRLEYLAYDLRLNLFVDKTLAKDNRIVIVDIDEKSLRNEGRWPWSRDKIAKLVNKISSAGATVIGFDVIFSEEERNSASDVLSKLNFNKNKQVKTILENNLGIFDNDTSLSNMFKNKDIVLGYITHSEENILPSGTLPIPIAVKNSAAMSDSLLFSMNSYTGNIAKLQNSAKYGGFFTLNTDIDGVIRRFPLLMRYKEQVYPSLPLQVYLLYNLIDEVKIYTENIAGEINISGVEVLPNTVIRTDGEGQVIIPYRGKAGSFPYVSSTDILKDKIDKKILQNKIILIGATATGVYDLRVTPLQHVYPGVEVHANIISAMLDNTFPVTPAWSPGANFVFMLLSGLLIVLIMPHIKLLPQMIFISFILLSTIAVNTWFWFSKGMVLSISLPIFMIAALFIFYLAYGLFVEARDRKMLKHIFGQYIPPELVDEMDADLDNYGFEGESREMTVMFADIIGFTSLSENLTASELKTILNRFFTPMTRIIFSEKGTIDKYMGDMIMAFWGAPLTDKQHALHAVNAAIQMKQHVQVLQQEFENEGLVSIDIGIGINTGDMNVGDMGSEYRRAYTVLGDAVNLGSRIEGLTRYYGVGILIGEDTAKYIQDDYLMREAGRVRVKGKRIPVTVYEPICLRAEADASTLNIIEDYEQALELYRLRDWGGAKAAFINLIKNDQDSQLYDIYITQSDFYMKNPPSPDWDGVFERRTK